LCSALKDENAIRIFTTDDEAQVLDRMVKGLIWPAMDMACDEYGFGFVAGFSKCTSFTRVSGFGE
jgi:hypothetical protein